MTTEAKQPIGMVWACAKCTKAKTYTPLEAGRVKVPKCAHCSKYGASPQRCVEGILVYDEADVAGVMRGVLETPAAVHNRMARDEVFRHLCALLDQIQVQSAGGTRIPNTCVRCEGNCSAVCECACHAAWLMRRVIELERAAAA